MDISHGVGSRIGHTLSCHSSAGSTMVVCVDDACGLGDARRSAYAATAAIASTPTVCRRARDRDSTPARDVECCTSRTGCMGALPILSTTTRKEPAWLLYVRAQGSRHGRSPDRHRKRIVCKSTSRHSGAYASYRHAAAQLNCGEDRGQKRPSCSGRTIVTCGLLAGNAPTAQRLEV